MKPLMRTAISAIAAVTALSLTACGGSGFNSNDQNSSSAAASANTNPLRVLIGSSGDAETKAVQSAADAWSKESGIKVTVVPAANLVQEASQGFASGKPADVLYVGTDQFTGWAKSGNLLAYGDKLANKDDFYPSLKEAFTYKDNFYCAPKDFSTLQLVINTEMWKAAGLTDADVPKTWDDLAAVAKKLTSGGHVGLATDGSAAGLGAFMAQAGGGLVTDGKATANSEANVKALTYVKGLLNDGSMKFAADLGASWSGEAFGKGKAAMVVQGNWITGAMSTDYKNVQWKAVELPQGAKKGTLQFTNCWGIAAKSQNTGGAQSLVTYLTQAKEQLAFSKAFGPMPSVKSAKEEWSKANPDLVPFMNGADYAQSMPAQPGTAAVIDDLSSKVPSLKTADPKALLDGIQTELEAALKG